jgi:hypothetical protein
MEKIDGVISTKFPPMLLNTGKNYMVVPSAAAYDLHFLNMMALPIGEMWRN